MNEIFIIITSCLANTEPGSWPDQTRCNDVKNKASGYNFLKTEQNYKQ